MSYFATLVKSSASSIPSTLMPYLAILIILVCMWCMIVIILRIKEVGVTKLNLVLIMVCLSTVIVLGFGAETAREIFAANDYIIAVLKLDDPDANTEDLAAALDSASSDEKKLLAFDIFSRTSPDQALAFLQANSEELPQNIRDRESRVLGLQAARIVNLTDSIASLENPKALEGIITLGEKDPKIARFLRQGKFDTSKLTEAQLKEVLERRKARIENGGIHIKER